MDLLWLTEEEVKQLLTMEEAIGSVNRAFFDQGMGKSQMPSKSYLYFAKHNGDLRTMPAYLEGLDYAGVKIVNVHPENPKIGLPSVMALLVLSSPETGAPVAIMGATYLTGMRTGAAGAVAARHLARPVYHVVGMLGAGVQARTQLLGLAHYFRIDEVLIFDSSIEQARSFQDYVQSDMNCNNCNTSVVSGPEEACNSDILVTTTPSRRPIILDSWIHSGTHINAIGADASGKQEMESILLKRAKVIVDDISQAIHSGEVNVPISEGTFHPEEIYAELGEILVGKKPGRISDEEITIFDSTGLGIQDVAAGHAVYEKAKRMNAGSRLRLD